MHNYVKSFACKIFEVRDQSSKKRENFVPRKLENLALYGMYLSEPTLPSPLVVLEIPATIPARNSNVEKSFITGINIKVVDMIALLCIVTQM